MQFSSQSLERSTNRTSQCFLHRCMLSLRKQEMPFTYLHMLQNKSHSWHVCTPLQGPSHLFSIPLKQKITNSANDLCIQEGSETVLFLSYHQISYTPKRTMREVHHKPGSINVERVVQRCFWLSQMYPHGLKQHYHWTRCLAHVTDQFIEGFLMPVHMFKAFLIFSV